MTGAQPGTRHRTGMTHGGLFAKTIASLGAFLLLVMPTARPSIAQSGHQLAYCTGYFALCAASTCKPTGRKIKVNVSGGGTALFPEANCTCPIFSGQGIADLAGGNMQGSCKPPTAMDGSTGVWSLYAIESEIAQAVTGWVPTGPKAQAPYLFCSKHLNLGDTIANCWSFACDAQTYTDTGVPVATCHCPIGEAPDGTAIAARTAFVSQAGQGLQQFCAKHPVGGPLASPLP
jgi:hypothetical protein